METSTNKSNVTILDRIRKFGGFMSNMVMPNLGAFVGWGIMAALFIPNGWLPNENLNQLVGPILNYVFPLLIGYTAGFNIHGQRGGVIGLFSTMGVIVGADITMISGAMILGPLSAYTLKKFDEYIQPRIKPGFEMFVNNFSLGIIGAIFCILGFLAIGPAVRGLIAILTTGVQWATDNNLIPLLSVFMAPAQVLFLNNVVNHGILAPIGYAQAAEVGKSIMFLVDTNNGPLLGTLFSFALFGKGRMKKTAPMAMFIAGIAGIGEVYFPFVLGNPIMVFATMGGLAVSLYLQVLLGGGLIGVASPGSLINIFLMTPRDALFANIVSIAAGFIVSAIIGSFLLKKFAPADLDFDPSISGVTPENIDKNRNDSNNSMVENDTVNIDKPINKIVVACDSGMGSSAFGATTFKNVLKKNGISNVTVKNSSANVIDQDTDMVITLKSLIERARISLDNPETIFIAIDNFLKEDDYDKALEIVISRNKKDKTDSSINENNTNLIESTNVFNQDNIRIVDKFNSKEDALRASGQILVDHGYVKEHYIEQILERETRISTYVGNNVAIPHGLEESRDDIIKSGISVIKVNEGVDFGDGNIANVLVGVAGKNNNHLELIQQVATVLADMENVQKIINAESRQEILDIIIEN